MGFKGKETVGFLSPWPGRRIQPDHPAARNPPPRQRFRTMPRTVPGLLPYPLALPCARFLQPLPQLLQLPVQLRRVQRLVRLPQPLLGGAVDLPRFQHPLIGCPRGIVHPLDPPLHTGLAGQFDRRQEEVLCTAAALRKSRSTAAVRSCCPIAGIRPPCAHASSSSAPPRRCRSSCTDATATCESAAAGTSPTTDRSPAPSRCPDAVPGSGTETAHESGSIRPWSPAETAPRSPPLPTSWSRCPPRRGYGCNPLPSTAAVQYEIHLHISDLPGIPFRRHLHRHLLIDQPLHVRVAVPTQSPDPLLPPQQPVDAAGRDFPQLPGHRRAAAQLARPPQAFHLLPAGIGAKRCPHGCSKMSHTATSAVTTAAP